MNDNRLVAEPERAADAHPSIRPRSAGEVSKQRVAERITEAENHSLG
jgi:hypothetical protein